MKPNRSKKEREVSLLLERNLIGGSSEQTKPKQKQPTTRKEDYKEPK